jgi:hypothetical protein
VRALDYLPGLFEESQFTATLDRVRTYTSAIRAALARASGRHPPRASTTPLAELERRVRRPCRFDSRTST